MLLRHQIQPVLILTILLVCDHALATEPNETFAQSTLLGPGVLSVTDDLSVASGDNPDTMVATLNSAGFITDFNDDGGPWEGSLGSGLQFVPINNDSSFWFLVTGNPDFDFNGSHDQSGNYHVYVDIFNDFGEFEQTIEYDDSLSPGEVDQFYMDGFNTFYTYDVSINNTVGGGGPADVDFYTFTGLTAGASFTAEVTQEIFDNFDSYLGWFDNTGMLIDFDDDDGFETLSLLSGTVPASGSLTLAVTGFGDEDFLGDHSEDAEYSLEITLGSVSTPGDFDNDSDIDGRDFLVWQRNPGVGLLADWQANYGTGGLVALAVPEPACLMLLGIGSAVLFACQRTYLA